MSYANFLAANSRNLIVFIAKLQPLNGQDIGGRLYNYLLGLWNPEVQSRIHKGCPIIHILSRINPIPRVDTYIWPSPHLCLLDNHFDYIRWPVQTMKFLIVEPSPLPILYIHCLFILKYIKNYKSCWRYFKKAFGEWLIIINKWKDGLKPIAKYQLYAKTFDWRKRDV